MLEGVARQIQSNIEERRPLSVGLLVALCLVVGIVGGLLTAAVSPLAGFAVVFAFILGLAVLVNTQVGLIAIVTIAYLLPFAVIPLPIGGLKLTFLDATLSAVLLIWILKLMARPEDRFVASPLDWLIVLFIGLALTSFIMGIETASGQIIRFFLKTINSILFFFTVVNCVRERRQLEQVAKAIMLGGFAAAVIALALYLLNASTATRMLEMLRVVGYPTGSGVLRYIAGTTTLRAIGTSIDPNVLGGMLFLALAMTVTQLFGSSPLFKRRFLFLMTAALLVALVLTFSRGSWVGALAAILFAATLRYRKIWLLVAVLVIVIFALPQANIVFQRMESGITFQDQAAQMRLGEYKDALRLIRLYPWFGVGFGEAPSIDIYAAASSIYLLMAEQMGLVGLGVFLLTMLVFFIYALKPANKIVDPSLQTLQMGALAGVVGALSAGLFDHYFFNLYFPHTIALFWLFVGLTVVATRLGKDSKT